MENHMLDLKSYIDSHYPALYLVTKDEQRVDQLILSLIDNRPVFEWNMAQGLVNFRNKQPYKTHNEEIYLNFAPAVIWMLEQDIQEPVFVIRDANLAMHDNTHAVACLKALFLQTMKRADTVTTFFVASRMQIPQELEKYITVFDVPLPNTQEIRCIIDTFVSEWGLTPADEVLSALTQACQGLAQFEIEQLLQRGFQSNGQIDEGDIHLINDAKAQIIRKGGKLEVIPAREQLTDIGGLRSLKKWLQRKAKVLDQWETARKFGVEPPKGILIAGMPGCGKSLTAKAAAHLFKLPLLRLDMGSLMGRYVGESENNMRQAIQVAEAVSPCVLWIDEIEKAFVGVGGQAANSSDVSTRMFGFFLTWMQEKTSQVFVIATANDLSALPVELLRKGRFDEMFYVDFPNETERKMIFQVHLNKRGKLNPSIQLEKLAQVTHNYSGADIEAVVKETIETSFIEGKHIDTDLLENIIKDTRPLGDVLKDKLKTYEQQFKEMRIKPAS